MSSIEILKYLELKNDYADDGPAWVAYVQMSRTGDMIYFNGGALQQTGKGRYREVASGQVYWVSGIKRDGPDRHWSGRGKVLIETRAAQEYMALAGLNKLESSKYTLIRSFVATSIPEYHAPLSQAESIDA
jgi:hypothetical protein